VFFESVPVPHRDKAVLSLEEMKALGASALDVGIVLTRGFKWRLAVIAASLLMLPVLIYVYRDILAADYIANQPLSHLSFAGYVVIRFSFAALLAVLYCLSLWKNFHFKLISFAVFAVALSAFINDISSIYIYVYDGALVIINALMLLRALIIICLFWNYWTVRFY
jgi:hypothetical protein